MKGGREGGEMQLSTPTTTKTTRVRHYNPLKKETLVDIYAHTRKTICKQPTITHRPSRLH